MDKVVLRILARERRVSFCFFQKVLALLAKISLSKVLLSRWSSMENDNSRT